MKIKSIKFTKQDFNSFYNKRLKLDFCVTGLRQFLEEDCELDVPDKLTAIEVVIRTNYTIDAQFKLSSGWIGWDLFDQDGNLIFTKYYNSLNVLVDCINSDKPDLLTYYNKYYITLYFYS